jgi:polyisoprenoid-binding protein YceI
MRLKVSAGLVGAVVCAAGVISTGVFAAPAKPAPKAAAKPAAAGSSWAVNKAASSIVFKSNFDGEDFQGKFSSWDAQITFDPKNVPASKVVATINTKSAATGDPSQTESLPTSQWFDVAKFPTATFTSTAWRDLGGGKYQVAGNLTLHGVTQPVTLNGAIAVNGNAARANFTTTIDRSKFGVGGGQFRSAETIPYGVGLVITIAATRK